MEPLLSDPDYQKVVGYLANVNVTVGVGGSRVPLAVESHAKKIRGYFNDGKRTMQVVIDRNTSVATLTVYANQSFYVVPEGFNLSTLLFPGKPSTTDQTNINLLVAKAKSQYPDLSDSTLAYADKTAQTYKIMLDSPIKGYVQCTGQIQAGKPVISSRNDTNYLSIDFTACPQFDRTGKCLTCDNATTVEYQGSCWEKI